MNVDKQTRHLISTLLKQGGKAHVFQTEFTDEQFSKVLDHAVALENQAIAPNPIPANFLQLHGSPPQGIFLLCLLLNTLEKADVEACIEIYHHLKKESHG